VTEDLLSFGRLIVGASMAIVGAKMNDETLKAVGLFVVGGVIGMEIPRRGRVETEPVRRNTPMEKQP
jgi:hypothetical protein